MDDDDDDDFDEDPERCERCGCVLPDDRLAEGICEICEDDEREDFED